jgi:hypothetical protein
LLLLIDVIDGVVPMLKTMLGAVSGVLGLLALSGTGLAADADSGPDGGDIQSGKPYVIVKTCANRNDDCTVRMDYAPDQRAMVVRPGSYWYQKPFQIHRYGDFKPQQNSHDGD